MRSVLVACAATATIFVGTPAMAAESIGGGGCMSDLTFTGESTLVSCYGRFTTNVLNNASNAQLNTALDALGYTGPDIAYNAINLASPSQVLNLGSYGNGPNAPVDFPGLLNGTVFVGIKTGNGGRLGVGKGTTFYRIDAVNLDVFTFIPQGVSTGALLVTAPPAVPEPSTWAMMLLGFGVVGAAMRSSKRRQRLTVTYA